MIVLRKWTFDPKQLYEMSRHFIWLIPLANLCLFLALRALLKPLLLVWPRQVNWLAPCFLCSLTLVPVFLVALPWIHGLAWLLVTLGVAVRLVPTLEQHSAVFSRLMRLSFPVVAGLVPILAATLWAGDWIKQRRQSAMPLPSPASANALLIVLDTVAAEHLSLYGYERATSPTMVELAERGIRFDRVQATSSWTLPSHASMFTGRWPHELSASWRTPIDRAYPTLAEFLSARGYATAGFVANYFYCATDSGLQRGFALYRDYIFPGLSAFKSASLVDRTVRGIRGVELFFEDWLDIDLLRTPVQRLWLLVNADRKDAAVVSREFLDWLARRPQPERPFFAFLNYYDAHCALSAPVGEDAPLRNSAQRRPRQRYD